MFDELKSKGERETDRNGISLLVEAVAANLRQTGNVKKN